MIFNNRMERTAEAGAHWRRDHLTHEPMKLSRSRIRRLRELEHPEYRLRLDPYRVFYDVSDQTVVVLAIAPKEETTEWLEQYGVKTT